MNRSAGVVIGVLSFYFFNGDRSNERQPSSSSAAVSGRRLCFAFRCAGRATSSGFARVRGCPGGATGLRMLSNTGLACIRFDFGGAARLAISAPPLTFFKRICGDASAARKPVSTNTPSACERIHRNVN